jgi:hypothetical protein
MALIGACGGNVTTLLGGGRIEADKLSRGGCFSSPQVFYPALVKIPATNWLPEIMEIIAHGYPFIASER